MILIRVKATLFRILERVRVFYKYQRHLSFFLSDLLLQGQYLLGNSFRIAKRFLEEKGAKEVYGYGETPLTTLDLIARKCRILSKDTVFELGCGQGRGCFWLSHFVGCHVVGIDFVPTFIRRANRVKKVFPTGCLEFQEKDFLTVDFQKSTVIYLYGTCLDDETIFKLVERFKTLQKGTKVITVSYPLTDYTSSEFQLETSFVARFPWGKADVYLNIKN